MTPLPIPEMTPPETRTYFMIAIWSDLVFETGCAGLDAGG
jgi:hypothetical protein